MSISDRTIARDNDKARLESNFQVCLGVKLSLVSYLELSCTSGALSSLQTSIQRACASRSILASDTFHRERSTADTYVLSNSHSSARRYCDQPFSTRLRRTQYAKTSRRLSGSGNWVGG